MIFQNKNYDYIDMSPNQTRVNERRIELPLAMEFVEEHRDNLLEVGNVLRHYKPRGYYTHDIVDLYETNPNFPEIINEDIMTFPPKKQYDAIVSISTLEHTDNPLAAVQRVISMAPHIFITIPIGYHNTEPVVDAFSDSLFLFRVNKENDWEEATREEVRGVQYNKPFPYANALLIIKI